MRNQLKFQLMSKSGSYLTPQMNAIHPFEAHRPEECTFILENDGVSTISFMAFGAYAFGESLLGDDLSDAYRFHRRQLQFMSAMGPAEERRWVLKCPFHLWNIDALLTAFPDAHVIHVHRRSVEALASVSSMNMCYLLVTKEQIDTHEVGRFWLSFYEEGARRVLSAREKVGEHSITDVHYTDLVGDPVGTMKHVADRLGLPVDASYGQRVTEFLATQSRSKQKPHQYDCERFGLEESEVADRFADYENQIGVR
jgi:hypothetical protein